MSVNSLNQGSSTALEYLSRLDARHALIAMWNLVWSLSSTCAADAMVIPDYAVDAGVAVSSHFSCAIKGPLAQP